MGLTLEQINKCYKVFSQYLPHDYTLRKFTFVIPKKVLQLNFSDEQVERFCLILLNKVNSFILMLKDSEKNINETIIVCFEMAYKIYHSKKNANRKMKNAVAYLDFLTCITDWHAVKNNTTDLPISCWINLKDYHSLSNLQSLSNDEKIQKLKCSLEVRSKQLVLDHKEVGEIVDKKKLNKGEIDKNLSAIELSMLELKQKSSRFDIREITFKQDIETACMQQKKYLCLQQQVECSSSLFQSFRNSWLSFDTKNEKSYSDVKKINHEPFNNSALQIAEARENYKNLSSLYAAINEFYSLWMNLRIWFQLGKNKLQFFIKLFNRIIKSNEENLLDKDLWQDYFKFQNLSIILIQKIYHLMNRKPALPISPVQFPSKLSVKTLMLAVILSVRELSVDDQRELYENIEIQNYMLECRDLCYMEFFEVIKNIVGAVNSGLQECLAHIDQVEKKLKESINNLKLSCQKISQHSLPNLVMILKNNCENIYALQTQINQYIQKREHTYTNEILQLQHQIEMLEEDLAKTDLEVTNYKKTTSFYENYFYPTVQAIGKLFLLQLPQRSQIKIKVPDDLNFLTLEGKAKITRQLAKIFIADKRKWFDSTDDVKEEKTVAVIEKKLACSLSRGLAEILASEGWVDRFEKSLDMLDYNSMLSVVTTLFPEPNSWSFLWSELWKTYTYYEQDYNYKITRINILNNLRLAILMQKLRELFLCKCVVDPVQILEHIEKINAVVELIRKVLGNLINNEYIHFQRILENCQNIGTDNNLLVANLLQMKKNHLISLDKIKGVKAQLQFQRMSTMRSLQALSTQFNHEICTSNFYQIYITHIVIVDGVNSPRKECSSLFLGSENNSKLGLII